MRRFTPAFEALLRKRCEHWDRQGWPDIHRKVRGSNIEVLQVFNAYGRTRGLEGVTSSRGIGLNGSFEPIETNKPKENK